MSKKAERIAWIIFFVMIIVIFISSSMTYKQQTIVPTLNKNLPDKPLGNVLNHVNVTYGGITESVGKIGYSGVIEFLVRKMAHFGSYFVMGVSLWVASYNYVSRKSLLFFYSWFTIAGLAAFDEFHQGFAAGRSPLISDVMLDSFGSLMGILLIMLIFKLIIKRKKAI